MRAPVREGCHRADPGQADPDPALRGAVGPHLRPRHQRAAGRPRRAAPVRRARGGAAGRGHHRAGGQAAPPRAGLLRPHRAADASTSCGSPTAGSTSRSRWATRAARSASSSTTPTRRRCRRGFRLGDNDTRILAVARNLANEGHEVTLVSKDLPLRIKASAVGLDAEEYRAEAISDSDTGYTGMAELDVAAADLDELYDDGTLDLDAARDLPCHQGLVLLSDRGTALGRVGPGQAGAPGARRPRGVRHPRPLRRAADRAGDAARPRGRDRLARRPGRHRQVGAGAVRRPRGGAGAPPAQEGRRLPAAVRGRRPGARLPARLGVREDVALGPGGLRHPRRDDLARTSSRRSSTAACSRCCR